MASVSSAAAFDSAAPKGPVICVFCGASSGNSPIYLEAARQLAQHMHSAKATLVYGGGTVGIMGELAKTLVQLSGPQAVHGFIPRALMEREKGFHLAKNGGGENNEQDGSSGVQIPQQGHEFWEKDYGKTTVVPDMHTRKRLMAQSVIAGPPGSGFVALPGGYGTLEELMEMVTWNQLGIHGCGIVVANVGGYWDGLVGWVRKAVEEGFVGEKSKGIMAECRDVGAVIDALREYQKAEGRLGLDWGEE